MEMIYMSKRNVALSAPAEIKRLKEAIEANSLLVGSISLTDLVVAGITAASGSDLVINNVSGKDVKVEFTDAAGARKFIFIDSGAAEVGSIDSNGVFTAAGGFVGALTGAVTGDVTGNVTGNVTGAVTGSLIAPADAAVDFADGHADYTLSATEKLASLLVVTSANQAANIIGPAENRQYVVRNASGQAITVKKTDGTGIAVADGKTAVVRYSSSVADYVRVTADATH
jgi:hypothetical protein